MRLVDLKHFSRGRPTVLGTRNRSVFKIKCWHYVRLQIMSRYIALQYLCMCNESNVFILFHCYGGDLVFLGVLERLQMTRWCTVSLSIWLTWLCMNCGITFVSLIKTRCSCTSSWCPDVIIFFLRHLDAYNDMVVCVIISEWQMYNGF